MAKNKCRLFIYGIDENVSNSELQAKFGEHGWITDIYNTGKGYAFVTFQHQSSADRAINDFHGANLFGKRIKVELANLRAGDEDGRMQRAPKLQSTALLHSQGLYNVIPVFAKKKAKIKIKSNEKPK